MMNNEATPERVIAALRGETGEMPVRLGTECGMGRCEEFLEADFLVKEESTRAERNEVIFAYAESKGWEAFRKMNVTYCPEHAEKREERS